jgi:hypothetical protein
MNSNYILGDQIEFKKESLSIEFKEFCLKCDNSLLYQYFDINYITQTGLLTSNDVYYFNQCILQNIKMYILRYIPRYASAFLNSSIKHSQLYFGIDDFGEITGIPFFGDKDTITRFINTIDFSELINQTINVKIEVIQLNIDSNYLIDNSHDILQDFYYREKKQKYLLQKYKIDRMKWADDMNSFTCKLPTLINRKKTEFDIYLNTHAPHIKNYLIHQHEMSNIYHLKINPDHYLYWLMQFKDENIKKLRENKPMRPNTPKIIRGPDYLFSQLTGMRCKLLNKNKNLNYYMIKISYPNSFDYNINYNVNSKPIYYYDIKKKSWLTKKRIFQESIGPSCL